MKFTYLTRKQAQQIDQVAIHDFSMASLVLMENAAIGATVQLHRRNPRRQPVLVIAGSGNNGGDALAIARQLAIRETPVAVIWIADPQKASSDCFSNWKILQNTRIPQVVIDPVKQDDSGWQTRIQETISQLLQELGAELFAWVVDGLLGTGAKGVARSPIDQIIRTINQGQWKVMAVDLPSGLDCDDGLTGGEVIQADVTCTFVSQKQAFEGSAVQSVLGNVEVASIGCPNEVLQRIIVDPQ